MGKITLGQSVFKALASETRLDILRRLDEKQKTLSDLSREMDLSKATIHEHLNKLVNAELISRREREGHKWIYYKLSWKGSSILHPEKTHIALMLTFGAISFLVGIASFIRYLEMIRPAKNTYTLAMDRGPLTQVSPSLLVLGIVAICTSALLLAFGIYIWKRGRNLFIR